MVSKTVFFSSVGKNLVIIFLILWRDRSKLRDESSRPWHYEMLHHTYYIITVDYRECFATFLMTYTSWTSRLVRIFVFRSRRRHVVFVHIPGSNWHARRHIVSCLSTYILVINFFVLNISTYCMQFYSRLFDLISYGFQMMKITEPANVT